MAGQVNGARVSQDRLVPHSCMYAFHIHYTSVSQMGVCLLLYGYVEGLQGVLGT